MSVCAVYDAFEASGKDARLQFSFWVLLINSWLGGDLGKNLWLCGKAHVKVCLGQLGTCCWKQCDFPAPGITLISNCLYLAVPMKASFRKWQCWTACVVVSVTYALVLFPCSSAFSRKSCTSMRSVERWKLLWSELFWGSLVWLKLFSTIECRLFFDQCLVFWHCPIEF